MELPSSRDLSPSVSQLKVIPPLVQERFGSGELGESEEEEEVEGMDVEVESGDDAGSVEDVELGGSDDEDDGGETGMSKAKDKPRLRMRRSFELVLVSGRVLRFEVRLRLHPSPLVCYTLG